MKDVLYLQDLTNHIAGQVNELIANQFDRARTISMRGQRLIDGNGALRIVSELTSCGQ